MDHFPNCIQVAWAADGELPEAVVETHEAVVEAEDEVRQEEVEVGVQEGVQRP